MHEAVVLQREGTSGHGAEGEHRGQERQDQAMRGFAMLQSLENEDADVPCCCYVHK